MNEIAKGKKLGEEGMAFIYRRESAFQRKGLKE